MFSKFKGNPPNAPQTPLDNNPILQYFDVRKQTASAGPELIWKIHDGYRKSDGKEVSIFVFEKRLAEKLHKPKRKETVAEILRGGVRQLERFRHPRILQVVHAIEECSETIAFATEPVMASLANILAYHEHQGTGAGPPETGASAHAQPQHPIPRPPHACDYSFLGIELKYGFLQLTEALSFLHCIGHTLHHNVCPGSIFVNKKGIWKLGGLEFTEMLSDMDPLEAITCTPWTSRLPKMAQPDLDYMAPEIQTSSTCSILSDMFSLGLVIFTVFNYGRSLIQANHSNSQYLKQLDTLDDQLSEIMPRVPIPLQEAASRLVNREPRQRPTAQLLSLITYFSDPAVQALQFLDVVNMKDPAQKNQFYRTTLKDILPSIPRKLWLQHVWPCLYAEMKTQESLASVLHPILVLIQECSVEEYENNILPAFRNVFTIPKTIQASVTLLENLHIILEKTPRDDIRTEVLPMLYSAFESSTIQVQTAALVAVANVSNYLEETAIRRMVLPKLKLVYEKNAGDIKIDINILVCIQKILDRLDRTQIIDEVLPLLWDVRLQDAEVIMAVVNIYQMMLSDKKYGLSVNLMATRVMPLLTPQLVNPALNLDQFTGLSNICLEMFDLIDRNQRNKLKLDTMPLQSSPDRHRPLRHLCSSDNMNVAPFSIPNVRVEQRKTSSAEDMARKNSGDSGMLGSWWNRTSPSSPDSNYLRVHNAYTNRRLSDNTLMAPKIKIAPSCASSPGGPGSPGGPLPIRRHSSFGPQERRGSTVNLSPPSGIHYRSSSIPRAGPFYPSSSSIEYLARNGISGILKWSAVGDSVSGREYAKHEQQRAAPAELEHAQHSPIQATVNLSVRLRLADRWSLRALEPVWKRHGKTDSQHPALHGQRKGIPWHQCKAVSFHLSLSLSL
ncbi:SCY1-like protein 2 isoform X2 [Bemisia tabaci]|uniref:SCY1-like protein 2 isoform X2 n=1 Tax=Bemisia tabaci TaxID=7038 RepID=UPI003B286235